MTQVRRGGIIYSQTSIQIPEDLHAQARAQKINISNLVRETLTEKLKECGGEVSFPGGRSPAAPSSTRR